MLALIVVLALTSPLPARPRPETVEIASDTCDGQVICWFDRGRRLCTCEPDMVSFGEWDPRPSPDDWPRDAYVSAPREFGTYPLEK